MPAIKTTNNDDQLPTTDGVVHVNGGRSANAKPGPLSPEAQQELFIYADLEKNISALIENIYASIEIFKKCIDKYKNIVDYSIYVRKLVANVSECMVLIEDLCYLKNSVELVRKQLKVREHGAVNSNSFTNVVIHDTFKEYKDSFDSIKKTLEDRHKLKALVLESHRQGKISSQDTINIFKEIDYLLFEDDSKYEIVVTRLVGLYLFDAWRDTSKSYHNLPMNNVKLDNYRSQIRGSNWSNSPAAVNSTTSSFGVLLVKAPLPMQKKS